MRRAFAVLLLAFSFALHGCGGGGGGSAPASTIPALLNSFGEEVLAAGVGDGGAAGADGTAGDGAPIVNGTVRVADTAGRIATGTTDTRGYYFVRIDGFTPPLVASVTRTNGQVSYSPSVTPIKVRGVVTINITGLTDKISSDVVALLGGKGGASALTPQLLAQNTAAVETARVKLVTDLSTVIAAAGLTPSTFNPVTLPFRTDQKGYDQVLESVVVTKDPQGNTVVTPKLSVGGTVSGLAGASGLVLRNGTENLSVAGTSTSFTFSTLQATGTTYAVSVATQPTGRSCTVSGGSGTVGTGPVTGITVTCNSTTVTIGGSISGIGTSSDLVLQNGTDALSVPANATSFTFTTPVAAGSTYSVSVRTQPAGKSCAVANASGTANANVTNVTVTCSASAFTLGGSVAGLTASGLVLSGAGQTATVAANATSYTFPSPVPAGTNYTVAVQTQPTGLTCTVANATGTMPSANVTNANVTCSASGPTVATLAQGLPANVVGIAAASDGTVYWTGSNHTINRIPSGSATSSVIGGSGTAGSGDGVGTSAIFSSPKGIVVSSSGDIYVVDSGNARLRKGVVGSSGVTWTTVAWNDNSAGSNAQNIGASASGLAIRGNTVYISSSSGNQVQTIDVSALTGAPVNVFGVSGGLAEVAADPNAANVIWARGTGGNLYSINLLSGNATQVLGAGTLDGGVALDSSSTVYATSQSARRVYKVVSGALVTYAGAGTSGTSDGPAGSATFTTPNAIAARGNTIVYIGDTSRIRTVVP